MLSKSQLLLHIYERLKKNKKLRKGEITSLFPISDQTFKRYIKEIRSYLLWLGSQYEIKYKRKEDLYVLRRKLTL